MTVNKKQNMIEVIARGIMLADDHILVCRPVDAEYCYLPGGHVEFSESAKLALVREIFEEIGIQTKPTRLCLVTEESFTQTGRARHELNLVFHVEHRLSRNDPVVSLEPGIAFEWLSPDSITGADLRPKSVKGWLVANLSPDWPSGTDWIPMAQLDDRQ